MKVLYRGMYILLFVAVLALSACAGMERPGLSQSSEDELREKARASLESLYASSLDAKALRSRSIAILVFPDIFKAGFLIGGSGGNGVLFSPGGQVLGYYNAASVSFGLQAGAQEFAEAMFLVTPGALSYLDSSAGWSIGVGPSVVVVDQGIANELTSTTLRSDVYAFIYGQQGLMAGLGVQGQKITRLRN